jgi:nitroimidazol reductase NimA-like FMN-containing flavoprotein (pyridoxamine 5'-phosphate oxidase superfamily)
MLKDIPSSDYGRHPVLAEMKTLIKEKNMCVLATIAGNKPYCSLMVYAANENCTEIYMATHRSTQKFRNLIENPAVSLMIDTREAYPRSNAKALTVSGECELIADTLKKEQVRSKLTAVHPNLKDFVKHPENEVLLVRIKSFLLLRGLTDAHYATLE